MTTNLKHANMYEVEKFVSRFDFKPVPKRNDEGIREDYECEYAECRKCGKRYKPNSIKRIVKHWCEH